MEYPSSLNDYSSPWPYELQPKESLPLSIFLLMPFVVGVVVVSALFGFNYLVIGLGVICATVFLMVSVREGFFVPTEIKYFILFAVWSVLGFLIVRYPTIFFERIRTLAQLVVMVVMVSYYAKNIRCVSWLFFSVLVGVCIVAFAAVITGDFQRAEVEGEEARLSGVILNANAFGRAVLYGMIVLLHYFRSTRSVLLKAGIVGLIFLAMRFVIASGSRTGFLGLAMLVVVWFILTYGKEITQRPAMTIAVLIGVILLGLYTAYLLRDTVLMKRLLGAEEVLSGKESGGGVTARLIMIKEGIYFTATHPILGIGLNHFPIYSTTELYAHNNYIEVFATTGIPGGIFYMMIYIVLIVRLIRVGKYPLSDRQRDLVNLFKAFVVIRLLLDFGTVSYYSKIDWIMLAIMIGYINHLQRELQSAMQYEQNSDDLVAQDTQEAMV
jgi:O-antigen ligase